MRFHQILMPRIEAHSKLHQSLHDTVLWLQPQRPHCQAPYQDSASSIRATHPMQTCLVEGLFEILTKSSASALYPAIISWEFKFNMPRHATAPQRSVSSPSSKPWVRLLKTFLCSRQGCCPSQPLLPMLPLEIAETLRHKRRQRNATRPRP